MIGWLGGWLVGWLVGRGWSTDSESHPPFHPFPPKSRRLEEAAAAYTRALEVNPENPLAKHALGALQVG